MHGYINTRFAITQFSSPAVPPPTVVVQPVNPFIPLVAGTARDLTCTISLTNVNDINVMVNFTWSTPMEILLSSSPRITNISGTTQSGNQSSFTSTLSISPLDSVADSTVFVCLVDINSDPADSFVTPTTANNSVDIDKTNKYCRVCNTVQWTDGESGGEGRLVTRLGSAGDVSDPWR